MTQMDSEILCEGQDVFLNDRECQYDHFELLFMSSSAQLAILAQGGGSGVVWIVSTRRVQAHGVSRGLGCQTKHWGIKRGLLLHVWSSVELFLLGFGCVGVRF